jgi:hypothetical protein
VFAEAEKRPERWRNSVRRAAAMRSSAVSLPAARLLDVIGLAEDVPILRAIGRAAKHSPADASLGRRLARRLAPQVFVEDQGRVEIVIGTARLPGTELRRKVLALLCYLLTRERFSATRDEVVDALWPDTAPEVAVNSLNQTVYFLRRVFEPGYKDDLSAGYVQHDSDVLWLDQDLIASRSQACHQLIAGLPNDPSPTEVHRLSDLAIDSPSTSSTRIGRFHTGIRSTSDTCESWRLPFRETSRPVTIPAESSWRGGPSKSSPNRKVLSFVCCASTAQQARILQQRSNTPITQPTCEMSSEWSRRRFQHCRDK